jgi:hypothetical protein
VARYTFERELDDPRLVWTTWEDDGFVAFTPPPVGTPVTLEAVELVEVFGKKR